MKLVIHQISVTLEIPDQQIGLAKRASVLLLGGWSARRKLPVPEMSISALPCRQLRTAWGVRRWFVRTNAHLTERALSVHSSRNRTSGLTDSARCAGIHVATRPRKAIATTTLARTNGSRGVA
jgi:hypothetical protein